MHNIDLIANDEFASAITREKCSFCKSCISFAAKVAWYMVCEMGLQARKGQCLRHPNRIWFQSCLKYKRFLDGISTLNKFKINNFHWKSFSLPFWRYLSWLLKLVLQVMWYELDLLMSLRHWGTNLERNLGE